MSKEFLFNQGLVFLKNYQPASALSLSNLYPDEDAKSFENFFIQAKSLVALGEYEKALTTLQSIRREVRLDLPANIITEIDRLEAITLLQLNKIQQCVNHCRRIMDSDSQFANCYLGKCLEINGRKKRAALYYLEALKINPFCGEAVDALIDRHLIAPLHLFGHIDKLNRPDTIKVIQSYKGRLPMYGNEVSTFISERLSVLQQIRKFRDQNRSMEAFMDTVHAMTLYPNDKELICFLLCTLVDIKDSEHLYEVALALSRKKSPPYLIVYAIGCFYFSTLNFEKAGRYFIRSQELDPFFAPAQIAHGHCYARLGEVEGALEVYEKAFRTFPGLHLCALYIGMQYSRKENWDIAMLKYREALHLVPRDPIVLNELGVVFFNNENYVSAHEYFLSAYENLTAPDNPSEYQDCILFNLATTYRKLRKYSEACAFYEQYIKLRPQARCGYLALGMTHLLNGYISSAIQQLEITMTMGHDSFCAMMLDIALSYLSPEHND